MAALSYGRPSPIALAIGMLAGHHRRHLSATATNNFSSVQFSYRIYVSRSLVIKITTAALILSSYEETFHFSASLRTIRVSVMSS